MLIYQLKDKIYLNLFYSIIHQYCEKTIANDFNTFTS